MTAQQIQQIQQLKYQQQQQLQQKQQQQQQQGQSVQIQHQGQLIQTKSSPQIQLISNQQHQQFSIQPQFSTGAKLTLQQQQQIQQQQQQQATNISLAKVASSQFQAQSPQHQGSQSSSPSSSVKILNSSISNLTQISSPQTTSVMSPLTNISSPVKTEPHHYLHQQMHQTPQSPKCAPKIVKMEEQAQKAGNENEYDNELSDVTAMFGVDLAAEKKSLIATNASKMSNLDQMRGCKEEKFLNIMILQKKFAEIG